MEVRAGLVRTDEYSGRQTFDAATRSAHNRAVAKAIASTLTLLLITAGSPATCVGWEGSAAARHACCARAHHAHAKDQAAADDCCARHEQSRHSEQAARMDGGTIAVVPAVLASTCILTAPEEASGRAVAAPRPHLPDLISPQLRI